MLREIGSEFWIEKEAAEKSQQNKRFLTPFKSFILTSSGRGAISLLLQNIKPRVKTVLLPAYTCYSVIIPFIEQGYQCLYYDINEDLSPQVDMDSFRQVGVFLHMGYFGFPTNYNVAGILRAIKNQGVIVVEDITHSFFSKMSRLLENDYYVGSIRKWFGIPSGGLLASSELPLQPSQLTEDSIYPVLREKAMRIKKEYLLTRDERAKELFLRLLQEAAEVLDKDLSPYAMDSLSQGILSELDAEKLINIRRKNFTLLSEGIKDIDHLEPMFHNLPGEVCPLFYPILVKQGRGELRNKLIAEKIYCPIHWDRFRGMDIDSYVGAKKVYETELSLPCDQRYGSEDMERIISVLRRG